MAEILSKHKGVIKVLLFILKNQPMDKITLSKESGIDITTLTRSLRTLEDLGLVEKIIERRGIRKSRAHVMVLTHYGKKVAELLSQIDSIIKQAAPSDIYAERKKMKS